MSIGVVRTVLKDFLLDDSRVVLALKGAWGTGKTYAWNEILNAYKERAKPDTYAYVSLFGISSIDELRTAIFAKSIPIKEAGKTFKVGEMTKNWKSTFFRISRQGSTWLSQLTGGYLGNISVGLNFIAPYFVRDMLICLDDYERIEETALPPSMLLGFVNELKEERACKVILIFNEDMNENIEKAYSKYREKIVDMEISFNPTPDEAIDLVFKDKQEEATYLRKHIVDLQINNIRIIRKILRLWHLIIEKGYETNEYIKYDLANSLVLLAWYHYLPAEQKPNNKFIRSWDYIRWSFSEKKENSEITDLEYKWADLLHRYGYHDYGKLSRCLDDIISKGYIEGDSLKSCLAQLDEKYKKEDKSRAINRAWNIYQNNFYANDEEFIAEIVKSSRVGIDEIGLDSLSPIINILRDLNKDAIADDLIDEFVEAHKSDTTALNPERFNEVYGVKDETLVAKVTEAYGFIIRPPKFNDAIKKIGVNNSWSKRDEEVVKAASEEVIFDYLSSEDDENLRLTVNAMLRFDSKLREKTVNALRRIAKVSELNAIRVRSYGIDDI